MLEDIWRQTALKLLVFRFNSLPDVLAVEMT